MFFFFKQKTAYEMRISDWSSDVCSSDLGVADGAQHARMFTAQIAQQGGLVAGNVRHRDIIQIAVGASEDRGRLFFKRHRRELSLLQQFRQARTAIEQLLGRSVEVRADLCESRQDRKSTRLNSSH